MKDLFIIPECYIDTNLVETLIITDGCNHQKGCNTVVKTMQQKFANAFSVGIIDEDKRQVSFLRLHPRTKSEHQHCPYNKFFHCCLHFD